MITAKYANKFHIVNNYGLFRVMTGVGGRPELQFEGSHDRINWKGIIINYYL